MLVVASALLLAVGVAGKATHVSSSSSSLRLNPKLDPKSDKVFFDHDYPHDLKPTAVHEFDHPFPTVQDSEDFDSDYVKDENSDAGEWKLQQKYDSLAQKLAQARAAAAKAKEVEERKYQDLNTHRSEEREARLEAREARAAKEKAEKRAEEKLEEAEHHLDEVMGKDISEGGIAKATENLKNETQDLEGCKKKLAEARAELKKVQEERLKREAAAKNSKEVRRDAEAAQFGREKEEAALEQQAAEEEEKYKAAQRTYDESSASLSRMEGEMKKAEEKVRHFRRSEDSGEGTYNSANPTSAPTTKSSARDRTHVSALVTAVVVAAAASAAQLISA